jgi:ABC-type multidrug transport system ATPase subunit
VDALLNGVALRAGTVAEASLDDRIVFHNDSELPLGDLRRRARALGGRFQLKAYKSSYLVSNNPSLLDVDDILLSPGTSGEVLLKILCNYEAKIGKLEVIQADRPILVGDVAVRGTQELRDGDSIRIDTGQVLRCNFSERIIEEERNIISSLELRDVSHRFRRSESSLDGISFHVSRGEMVCVMGASGCGKSTLMRAIAGQLQPGQGEILLNGQSLYTQLDELKRFISYIPQDDAFDEHLTIEENLEFAAAIRSPHLSSRDRTRRIEGKLVELGLSERRDSVVGSPVQKRLSGGERKRLNIGLDMISSADVFLFDEPTSGLSSKDSEHVIDIIRSMAHNKIVLVTIHQPNSKLFQMFSKALLLDKGGKLVFYGTPSEMLGYFAAAEHEQHFGTELGGCPACGTTRPEFIFDVLETPLRDLSGDIIYEENSRAQFVPARRFSPDYWRDKYESFRLLQDMRQVSLRKTPPNTPPPAPAAPPVTAKIRWRDEWTQLRTLLRRTFLSKLRNRGNIVLTALVPPLLALLVGWALYFTDDASGEYDFASAFHIPTYIFIALLVALFLALMNSVDDIIRDRVLLNRERNLDVRLPYYILSKFSTLTLFTAIQCALFVLVGNHILEIRGMFWPYFLFMVITAASGTCLGLVISSIVSDSKTAANFVPLVLIPQLIFGGALIKYEEMNRDLDLKYTFSSWFKRHPEIPSKNRDDSALAVPMISRLLATHYSYEALIVAQYKLNPLSQRQDQLLEKIDAIAAIAKQKSLTPAETTRMEDLKETLALLSGLVCRSAREVEKRLRGVDKILDGKPLDASDLRSRSTGISVDQIYTNQKVSDLVSKAEGEQNDYRRQTQRKRVHVNVFFGPEKRYVGITMSVFSWNSAILVGSSAGLLGLLYLILKRQLRPHGL